MKQIITLRQILDSKFPNGHRLVKKTNTNHTKRKK
jgi:hypothetical protein